MLDISLLTPIEVSINTNKIEVLQNINKIEVLQNINKIEVNTFGNININVSTTGNIESLETIESISAYKIVASVNGKIELADKDNLNHLFSIAGISTTGGSIGSFIFIQNNGIISNELWSWDENIPLWLGNLGELTQISPETGFLIQCGIALSSTKILIEIQEGNLL